MGLFFITNILKNIWPIGCKNLKKMFWFFKTTDLTENFEPDSVQYWLTLYKAPTVTFLFLSSVKTSKMSSRNFSSPKVKYSTSLPFSAAAINCKRLFNWASPPKAPQPQLPVATQLGSVLKWKNTQESFNSPHHIVCAVFLFGYFVVNFSKNA